MTELDKDYYFEEAKKLDIYQEYYETPEYSLDYIDYLKRLMVKYDIQAEKVIECLPISYVMSKYLILGRDMEVFGEKPYYYISTTDEKEYATFKTSQFIQKEYEGKRLIRKK